MKRRNSVPLSREKETEVTTSFFWKSTEWKFPHLKGLHSHLGRKARPGLPLRFLPPRPNEAVSELWKLVEGW